MSPTEPTIAFFDMDHTVMDNDCDLTWKYFLVDEGLAEASEIEEADRFHQEYLRGEFKVEDYLVFQLRQFAGRTPDEMAALARRHFERHARERVYPAARDEVAAHRAAGRQVWMLTATSEVIARPVAEHLGMDGLLATRLEMADGRYTGRVLRPYCFLDDKVMYARQVCDRLGLRIAEAAYYGDSQADIPMLEAVGAPVAINPQGRLLERAREAGWPVRRWRL